MFSLVSRKFLAMRNIALYSVYCETTLYEWYQWFPKKNPAHLKNLRKIEVSIAYHGFFGDPIQNHESVKTELIEAVYLKALLYLKM